MLILVLGASASGKSEFAEKVCVNIAAKPLYIATMQPFGGEAAERIARHQLLRQGKGFAAQEQYTDIGMLIPEKQQDTALLECLSNLLANELYSAKLAPEKAIAKVCDGLEELQKRLRHLIIVSNAISFDGEAYAESTLAYMQALGQLNCAIAKKANYVVEVVSGIPLYHKGEKRW